MSLISDASKERVQWFARLRRMHEAVGVSPYGGDLNRWSAKDVDAFLVLEGERKRVEQLSVTSDLPPSQRVP